MRNDFPQITLPQEHLGTGEADTVRGQDRIHFFEFSACLERRLLKRRTTVSLSNLASRTYAGVEPIKLRRT